MRNVVTMLLALSCGGATMSAPPVFGTTPTQVVTSSSGALSVQVFEPVDRPVSRGVNAVRFELQADASVDLTQETLTLTPWMPVMGHGSSVVPSVTVSDGGFVVTNVYLAMPGTWELRCDFGGPVVDHATVSYQVQ